MPARMSEAEYAALVGKSPPGKLPAPPRRIAAGQKSRANRKRASQRPSTSFRELLPVFGAVGVCAAIGWYLATRKNTAVNGYLGQCCGASFCLPSLCGGSHGTAMFGGCAKNASYGSEIGSIIGQIIPIPGLSTIGSFVGGLFGPSQHYTPSGMTMDQATFKWHQGYFEMIALINQVRSLMKLSPVAPIGFVGLGTPGCSSQPDDGTVCPQCASMNCGAVNAPLTGPYFAKLLANPALASQTSESDVTTMETNGTADAVIAMQEELISRLQNTIYNLQDGLIVPYGGRLVPASCARQGVDANSQTAINENNNYSTLTVQQAVADGALSYDAWYRNLQPQELSWVQTLSPTAAQTVYYQGYIVPWTQGDYGGPADWSCGGACSPAPTGAGTGSCILSGWNSLTQTEQIVIGGVGVLGMVALVAKLRR